MGLLTEEERKNQVIEIWNEAKNKITDAVRASLDKEGPVYSMVYSKARGSESVVVQMTGMKGLDGRTDRRNNRTADQKLLSKKDSMFWNISFPLTAPEKVWLTRLFEPRRPDI